MVFCLDWHCQGLSCKILIGHICFPERTRRGASSAPADLPPLVTRLKAKLLVFCVESRGPAEDLTLPFRNLRSPFHSDTPVPDGLMVTPPITEKSIVLSQKAPCSITLGKQARPRIELLGADAKIRRPQGEDGLRVQLPRQPATTLMSYGSPLRGETQNDSELG
jgi:hypothetical protein